MSAAPLQSLLDGYRDAIAMAAKTPSGRPGSVEGHLAHLAKSISEAFVINYPAATLVPRPMAASVRSHGEGDKRRFRPSDNRTFLKKHRANLTAFEKAIASAGRPAKK